MPVEYSGIVDEHLAVRTRAGLFDVSHMGEIGDFLNTMAPALTILRSVKPGVQEVVPMAEKGFADLSQSLSSIVTEAGYNTILNAPIETANADASDILSEAVSVAEHKLKDKFPELPAEVTKERVQI